MSSSTFNPVAVMQEDLSSRLEADAYFSDINVFTERRGSITGMLANGLRVLTKKGNKIGVAVMVGLFEADANNENAPGPIFDDGATLVSVFENPTLNSGASGSGKAALDIAVRVARVLHHYYPGGIGQTVLVSGKAVIQPIPERELGSGMVGYMVRVGIPLDSEELDKVLTPSISPTSGAAPQTVTLACATAGAAIYYTTDLSYPWSGNEEATLYAAPFEISQAATLRAVASKTDMVDSDCASAAYA